MPFDAPFKLGPFTVDSEGRVVSSRAGPAAPVFLFRWHGRVVRALWIRRTSRQDDCSFR